MFVAFVSLRWHVVFAGGRLYRVEWKQILPPGVYAHSFDKKRCSEPIFKNTNYTWIVAISIFLTLAASNDYINLLLTIDWSANYQTYYVVSKKEHIKIFVNT